MSITAFRITKTKFVDTAFTGEGARLFGGRWNSIGTRMVYLAGSLSAATLELLVHTDDYETIDGLYSYIPVNFPAEISTAVDVSELPNGWDAPILVATTQQLGDAWVSGRKSAILRVPSAITSGEFNYLVNPDHPDFVALEVGNTQEFKLDPRI